MKKYFAWIEKLSSFYKIPVEKQKIVFLKEAEVFTCKLVLPVMPKKEIAEAIRWELPLHVPFEDGTYLTVRTLEIVSFSFFTFAYLTFGEIAFTVKDCLILRIVNPTCNLPL